MSAKATTDQIVAAYRQTGSVWKAGKLLGLAGQSVHERLVAIDHPLGGRNWTDAEVEELRALAAEGIPLGEVARRLGRPYGGAAAKAGEVGLKFRRRNGRVEVPRGAGFDKASMTRHMRAIEAYGGSVTQYARAHGLHVDPFVKACQRYFPDRWEAYVRAHSELPMRVCGYCGREFVPNSGRQRHCDRKCAEDARRDKAYYGGRRRDAIGLIEGICQCCGRRPKRGLSAHHMLGKDNDPEDSALVALCSGCHNIVTLLAASRIIDTPGRCEALLSLAWTRRNGEEGARIDRPWAVWVRVEIDVDYDDD